MSNGKGPVKALIDDKKVQQGPAHGRRVSARRLRSPARQDEKKRRRLRKLLVIGLVGAALALVLSEDLRKAVLDRLFGAEEEFEYTSTTTPAPEPTATE